MEAIVSPRRSELAPDFLTAAVTTAGRDGASAICPRELLDARPFSLLLDQAGVVVSLSKPYSFQGVSVNISLYLSLSIYIYIHTHTLYTYTIVHILITIINDIMYIYIYIYT